MSCAVTANTAPQSSNYSINSDVISGGGGESSSDNYSVEHTTGEATAIGDSSSDNYGNQGGFWYTVGEPDTDGDGIVDGDDNCAETANPGQEDFDNDGAGDVCDNCNLTANAGQQDTDSDGYGNICDADLDNDGAVGVQDFNVFKVSWLATTSSDNWNPDADFDSDGAVGVQDFNIFKGRWLSLEPWD